MWVWANSTEDRMLYDTFEDGIANDASIGTSTAVRNHIAELGK